jgi:preprotein translocase subunit SecG
MSAVIIILTGVHVVVGVALITIVLLQEGSKGAGLSGVFGAGGAATESFFGGRGPAPFLAKVTTGAAIVFMVTCLVLAKFSTAPRGGRSVMEKTKTTDTGKPPAHKAPARKSAPR